MTFTAVVPLSTILDRYDAVMFDLWGVLVEGEALYDGVANAVHQLMQQKPICFISNSPRPRKEISERMKNFGIHADTKQFFTSGQMTYDLLYNKQNIYYLTDSDQYNLIPSGSTTTSNIAAASVILLAIHVYEGGDLNKFNAIFRQAIDLGIMCICANPDTIIPNRGKLCYCPGYFAKIYEDMGGTVTYIGKPGVSIFHDAVNSLTPKPKLNRVLMIGDTLEIDIFGANKAGMHSALVMTGNTARITASCKNLNEKLQLLSTKCETLQIAPNMIVDITI